MPKPKGIVMIALKLFGKNRQSGRLSGLRLGSLSHTHLISTTKLSEYRLPDICETITTHNKPIGN